jgi:hypothetical protein
MIDPRGRPKECDERSQFRSGEGGFRTAGKPVNSVVIRESSEKKIEIKLEGLQVSDA